MSIQVSGEQQGRGQAGNGDAPSSDHAFPAEERPFASILPVFPLPIFILPGGVSRLRIFEPRYLKMVAEADKTGGFVIACFNADLPFNVAEWGTKVEIIDFDQDKEGLLLIDVRADYLVNLSDFHRRQDKLLLARSTRRNHWSAPPAILDHKQQPLGIALKQLFDNHPELSEKYAEPRFEQLQWVCARFLELLPLSLEEKEQFISPDTLPQLEKFLQLLILGEEKPGQGKNY